MGFMDLVKGAGLLGASAAISAIGVDSGLNLLDGSSDNELVDVIKTGASVVGTTVCVSKGLSYLAPKPVHEPELDEMMEELIKSENQTVEELSDINQQMANLMKENQELAAQVKELEALAAAKKSNSKKSTKVDLVDVVEESK